jgi:hypothetical protein
MKGGATNGVEFVGKGIPFNRDELSGAHCLPSEQIEGGSD